MTRWGKLLSPSCLLMRWAGSLWRVSQGRVFFRVMINFLFLILLYWFCCLSVLLDLATRGRVLLGAHDTPSKFKGLWGAFELWHCCIWPWVRQQGRSGWGRTGSSCPLQDCFQRAECYLIVTQSSAFLKRGLELGYEISCLLGVMMLPVFCFSSWVVGSQMFMVLLCLKTYIWQAYTPLETYFRIYI